FFKSPPHSTSHHSFPTRRSSDLIWNHWLVRCLRFVSSCQIGDRGGSEGERCSRSAQDRPRDSADDAELPGVQFSIICGVAGSIRSEEHTSELQSLRHLVCRLLLE